MSQLRLADFLNKDKMSSVQTGSEDIQSGASTDKSPSILGQCPDGTEETTGGTVEAQAMEVPPGFLEELWLGQQAMFEAIANLEKRSADGEGGPPP